MANFSTATSKLSRLDGHIFSAQYTIERLQTLLGGDYDTAINIKVTDIQAHIASLNQSLSYYDSKDTGAGAITAETLIENYVRGFSEQVVIFDGWPLMCREKDKLAAASRMNAMMAQPDESFNMETMIGVQSITVEQCQGLMYAGDVLANVIRAAADETLNQHKAHPFGTWTAMRNYFNQYFENNYVPFLSS